MVAEQRVLLLADLDRAPAVLRDQHLVAGLHRALDPLALPVEPARADGEHLRLVELLDGRLWQEDAARRLGLGLDALHEHPVEQRGNGADGLECGRLEGGGDQRESLGGSKGWRERLLIC